MKNVLSPLVALAGLLAFLAVSPGCSTKDHQVNTVEPANPAYVRRNLEDKRIVRDKATAKAVTVLNVIDGTTPEGTQRVGVEVQNLQSRAFRFNYRFDWFDAQGFPVATPTATMVSQQIEAGQILVLTSVAPHAGARDFRLTVQESTSDRYPRLPRN